MWLLDIIFSLFGGKTNNHTAKDSCLSTIMGLLLVVGCILVATGIGAGAIGRIVGGALCVLGGVGMLLLLIFKK